MNKLVSVQKIIFKNVAEFFASPEISALCQANPLTSGIATYFSGKYSHEQYETLTSFVHLLHSRLRSVEDKQIDKDFFDTQDGKRIIGKVFKSIIRDSRIEKLTAMSNLTVNLYIKSKLTVDEKEVYVDILDNLNVLQLSILQNAVLQIQSRKENQHRGFGWEEMQEQYKVKGVTGALLLQSIRALESNGLVNQNDATIQEKDKTHFVTIFGEQFYSFIADPLTKENPYIL